MNIDLLDNPPLNPLPYSRREGKGLIYQPRGGLLFRPLNNLRLNRTLLPADYKPYCLILFWLSLSGINLKINKRFPLLRNSAVFFGMLIYSPGSFPPFNPSLIGGENRGT